MKDFLSKVRKQLPMWLLAGSVILAGLAFWSQKSQAAERWIIVGDGGWQTVSGSPIVENPDSAWTSILQRTSRHQIVPINNDNTGFLYNGGNLLIQIEAAKVLKPTGIIIAAGVVDWVTSQPLTTVLGKVQAAVVAAKASGVKVVCLTPHYRTDWQTRRMPLSAKGRPLFTVPSNPGVTGFANIMGAYCSSAGAAVVWGHHAAVGLANVGPLTQFVRTALLPAGHEAVAAHVYQQLVNMGLMQVQP